MTRAPLRTDRLDVFRAFLLGRDLLRGAWAPTLPNLERRAARVESRQPVPHPG
jgi:hypothetical protein